MVAPHILDGVFNFTKGVFPINSLTSYAIFILFSILLFINKRLYKVYSKYFNRIKLSIGLHFNSIFVISKIKSEEVNAKILPQIYSHIQEK
jgi:hypothetical protein